MFDHHRDAFLEGAFRVTIEVTKAPDGGYVAKWEGPNGQVVEAVNDTQAQAHRDVSDRIRLGVMDGSLVLGS